ncbi:MAG: cyclic nucleotide-binding domain-containing protein [Rhodospirillales bacterium]|nr:cyclic nucleotide-binding domain-containing protein [Rhodospirillales bacterium]
MNIEELLREQPLFSALTDDEISGLSKKGEIQNYSTGNVIFEEGDEGDAAYIVVKGCVDILKGNDSGKQTSLALLGENTIFGERAILAGEPRMATVKVVENVTLLRFSCDDFTSFCNSHPRTKEIFSRLADNRALDAFLRLSTPFSNLPPEDMTTLISGLQEIHFNADDIIYQEGDESDALYIVIEGEIEVRNSSGSVSVLPGNYFGAHDLLKKAPRTAKAVAVKPALILKMDKYQFIIISAAIPDLRGILEKARPETD